MSNFVVVLTNIILMQNMNRKATAHAIKAFDQVITFCANVFAHMWYTLSFMIDILHGNGWRIQFNALNLYALLIYKLDIHIEKHWMTFD